MGEKCEKCDAHEYLEHTLEDIKTVEDKIGDTLVSVRMNITKLTENLEETKRTNDRLEKILLETKKEVITNKGEFDVFKTRVYTYGSVGVIVLSSLSWVGDKALKYFFT